MAKSKLTPQEIYRQRKRREELEKTAYLPPGLINHGNTCFMNSVLQGLLATRLLADLVYFNPIPHDLHRTMAGPIVSTRSPQLMNGHGFAGHHKLPYVSGMPIGDAFLDTVDKAWVAQANRRREVLSPRTLLATMGRKYDQYLDFAQQDAHEFLRILLDAMRMEEFDIIKVRQPPPPPKKRRRTTITPENAGLRAHLQPNGVPLNGISPSSKKLPSNSSQSTPMPRAEDLPLMSFVDMIFGGQLTSILVCQKCKHVSQTYEDFNDISLSLKPEDYANRKRDRIRKIVGRLTNFPSSTFTNLQTKEKQTQSSSTTIPMTANMETQRSSSVPPTPSEEKRRSLPGGGLEGPIGASRRRSLDVSVESLLQDGAAVVESGSLRTGGHSQDTSGASEVKAKDVDEDYGMISDGSHIIVNVNGPEERHVEFVESKQRKEEIQGDQDAMDVKEKKQPEEAAWSRFGRRISLNLGLGRQKDKKERERKVRSIDPSLNTGGIKEDEMEEIVTAVNSVSVVGAAPKSRGSPTETPNDAESLQPVLQQPIPSGLPSSKQYLLPNPDLAKVHAPNVASKFPTIQRSKSPKPPKPSPAETEYLRKILADVSFPSNNPFALLRPPLLHAPVSDPPGEKEKIGGPAWLGLGTRPFTGIEECLRMFTAVEVLDGENMVGCRRCWKIQNGVFQSKKDDSDEEDGEDWVESPMSVPGLPNHTANIEPPSLVVQPSLIIPSPSSPIHLQASQSTPTVSYYPHKESHSISSLPTSISDANLNLLKDNSTSADSSVSSLSLSIVSERSECTKESDGVTGHRQGPGGLPIPIISTTAPMEASSTSSSMPSDSGSESNYSSASEGKSPLSESIEELNRRAAYAQLTRGLSKSIGRSFQVPLSTDSLVIPPRTHGNRRKLSLETTTDEESSEDESDAAESISAESRPGVNLIGTSEAILVSEKTSSQQSHGQVSEKPQKKVSKPKPVIMRPAYKRYLIDMPPPVLVIHLKRFQQTLKAPLMLSFSNGFKKLDDYVSFPEYLDLSPFLAPRKEDYGLGKKRKEREFKKKSNFREERCMYRLYGVVVHIGNMLGGHYIAYTALPNETPRHRSPDKLSALSETRKAEDEKSGSTNLDSSTQPRQWAYVSDTHVRLTTLEEVLNSKAYICMYERY